MKKFIEENIDNMIQDLSDLVACKSVRNDDMLPFGSENRKVLDLALSKMDKIGLKTENVDYYCGYGEVGEGEKLVGILAHLDVVPVSDGWLSDPFKMDIRDNVLYGRGVADDKGAVVASMYALKYLIDTGYKFNKRFRLITGCGEETGSECIKYYVKKCGHIDMGFTPDGGFPGIYAEKGALHATIVGKDTKIIDMKGGDASNVVCKKMVATLPENSFNVNKFDEFMKKNNIQYEYANNELTVYGKAAHASTPDLGVNAINYMMAGLQAADFNDPFVDFFMKHIGLDLHGESLGYEALKDDITNTSINIGVAYKEDGAIKLTLDMRYPVKTTLDKAKELLSGIKEGENEIVIGGGISPLFFDKETPFVKALLKAYQDVTGDTTSKMEAIGGGTYAKSINNCIAFGCEFMGEQNNIHDANECLKIESLRKQVEIYIEALKNLNEI